MGKRQYDNEIFSKKNKKPDKNCRHLKTKIVKLFRKNYPFGKKSRVQFYAPPKTCFEVCEKCGKVLDKWKPIR